MLWIGEGRRRVETAALAGASLPTVDRWVDRYEREGAAAHLAERACVIMHRRMPYVICYTTGEPVTTRQAKKIIAEEWTVPSDVRARRRSRKTAGRGGPLNKSTQDIAGQTHTAPTNEASFPAAIVARH